MFSEKINERIEYISKNFILMSTSLTLTGLGLSYIYLSNYLITFDSRLIDYVEYADYIKIGMKFGFLAIPFVANLTSNFFQQKHDRVDTWKDLVLFVSATTALALATFLILRNDYKHRAHEPAVQSFLDALIYSGPLWFLSVINYTARFINNRRVLWVGMGILIFTFVSILGLKNGEDVRYDRSNKYNVTMKLSDRFPEDLQGATLVLALSHHLIMFKDGRSIVVQSPDVEALTSVPPSNR